MTAAATDGRSARNAGRNARRRVSTSESVVCAELGDEAVLLNIETGIYFGLDAVGAEIWGMVVAGLAEDEIHRRLLADYDVPPERLRADLDGFLDALIANGLARVVDRS